MMSFIHNGSEKTIWIGHNFNKLKPQIRNNIFKKNYIFLEFQAAYH